ncbi:MAG: REP-associated tyrosine transposase [Deferrisomatales bacterium]
MTSRAGSQPHQRALRLGRVSVPGAWYSITSCIEGRRHLLVGDPSRPLETGEGARVVRDALEWLAANGRWVCHAHCIMPDHVHAVVELADDWTLPAVMKAFGNFTARGVNGALGRTGRLWQKGFYDHALRREESLEAVARYVLDNPVRKGWVEKSEDWPWSGTGFLR